MQVYSWSSASSKMNSMKEETYRIARSLGAASNSRVIANVDHHTVGLLSNQSAASFVDACAGSFLALEVKRGLLKVPNSSLIEAVNFHAASVSGRVFTYIHFVALFLPGGSFLWCI
jgi:hypothetical protein